MSADPGDETGVSDAALTGGPELGIGALEAAIARLREANSRVITGGGAGPVAYALGEAMFWVAALDNHFKGSVPDYWDTRASEEKGRTVGGVIYARNALGHGLFVAGAVRFQAHPPTLVRGGDKVTLRWARLPGRDYGSPDRGTAFSAQLIWVDLANLPPVSGTQHERDQWYSDHVAGRPVSHPLNDAADWYRTLAGLERTEQTDSPGAEEPVV